jgi:hypothetical protein
MDLVTLKMDALQLATDIMGECGDPEAVLGAADMFVSWALSSENVVSPDEAERPN